MRVLCSRKPFGGFISLTGHILLLDCNIMDMNSAYAVA